MSTGVQRIVTISCTDSDDARWRRPLAQGGGNDWRQALGRALFTGDTNRASLKVSFFGPFYGGYHLMALDQQNYQRAMVLGPNRDYLWILAREKRLPEAVREQLLREAGAAGIDTRKLIWVEQTRPDS